MTPYEKLLPEDITTGLDLDAEQRRTDEADMATNAMLEEYYDKKEQGK